MSERSFVLPCVVGMLRAYPSFSLDWRIICHDFHSQQEQKHLEL
jgi:hypothetical protein